MIYENCNDFLKSENDRLYSNDYVQNLIKVNLIKKDINMRSTLATKHSKYILEGKTFLRNANKNKKSRIEWRHKLSGGKYLFLHIEITKLSKSISFEQGYEVHHYDENSENNDPLNLIVLPSAMHREFHKGSLRAKNIIDKIYQEMNLHYKGHI